MITDGQFKHFYPDNKKSGTRIFYELIASNIKPESSVLNLGAGSTPLEETRKLKGKVKKYIGADIDLLVLKNKDLDEAYVIKNDILPFDDATFDFIISDFVLEHIENPIRFIKEIHRVIKFNGSFLFRTPNKYHYVSLISFITPHWFHKAIANKIRGLPKESHEPYKTFYRMNTNRKLESLAYKTGFNKIELILIETEPMYLKFNIVPFLLGVAYERIVNRFSFLSFLRVNIIGRLVK